MFYIKQNESNSDRLKLPVYLVDAVDGYTPKTGSVSASVYISKNGATPSSVSRTVAAIGTNGDGTYTCALQSGDVDTIGWLHIRIVVSGVRDYNAIICVTTGDPLDMLGGAFVAGTVGSSPTQEAFVGVGAALSSANDFYNGSVLAFTSGPNKGVARRIVDYAGSTKTLCFVGNPFPGTVSANETFVILGRIE